MKLNHDCIRELMLYIEENLEFGEMIDMSIITISDFSEEDTIYSAVKLHEAGYLSGDVVQTLGGEYRAMIRGITWEGHKFLDTIRDNQVWSHTKTVLSKVSSASISFTSSVASQVLTNLISQSLGGQPIL